MFKIRASAVLVFVICGTIMAEDKRTWTSSSGNHTIEAKFIRVEEGEVVLRKSDGKQIRVPLEKLATDDRASAETMELRRVDRLAIERTARQFLLLLRQSNREGAEKFITAGARSLWENEQSPIKNIPSVDRGSKPSVRGVEIDEGEATAAASLRYKGKSYPATLHLRKEEGDWLIYAATGEDEEGESLHFDFEGDAADDGAGDGAVVGGAFTSISPAGPLAAGETRPSAADGHAAPSLMAARADFQTAITGNDAYRADGPAPEPPDEIFELIKYPAPVGSLSAYLTPDPRDNQKHPAVVWAHGGFGGVGSWLWEDAEAANDQSARAFREAGLILMCPSWRGENDNPGQFELFYGEVEDVIAAGEYVKQLPYVDPSRVYLAGHSTGGTIALLAAESTDLFRAVFSFGGAPDMASVMKDGEGYGNTPYDLQNEEENRLRSPIEFVSAIRSPTFYFEGAVESFYPEDARRMSAQALAAGVPLNVHIIESGSHFDILAPLTKFVAKKIKNDNGPTCLIIMTPDEVNRAYEG